MGEGNTLPQKFASLLNVTACRGLSQIENKHDKNDYKVFLLFPPTRPHAACPSTECHLTRRAPNNSRDRVAKKQKNLFSHFNDITRINANVILRIQGAFRHNPRNKTRYLDVKQ